MVNAIREHIVRVIEEIKQAREKGMASFKAKREQWKQQHAEQTPEQKRGIEPLSPVPDRPPRPHEREKPTRGRSGLGR